MAPKKKAPLYNFPAPMDNDTLVGHSDVMQRFMDAWAARDAHPIHPVWMLTGPRGIGKATLAYRIAKMVYGNVGDFFIIDMAHNVDDKGNIKTDGKSITVHTVRAMIDKMQNGKILLGYIFIASWGTDVFAYLIGKKFGKHKFSKVSPKKSIEGCIAGTIGAVLIMVLYTFILNRYFQFNYSYMYVIIVGIVLSLIGQIGDFSASCIKRYVDIKDYSNLLPGHGGMLDRIDSVLFIAPFAYMLFTLI